MAKNYNDMKVAELQAALAKLDAKKQDIRFEQLRLRSVLDVKLREEKAEERKRLRGDRGETQVVRPDVINLTAQDAAVALRQEN